MSYASSYANKPPNAKGIGITVGIHALVFAGAMALPAITAEIPFEGTIEATNIPIPPENDPTPPPENQSSNSPPPESAITKVPPIVNPPAFNDPPPINIADADSIVDLAGAGAGDGTAIILPQPLPIIPKPVVIEAKLNPRYAGQFQPQYPTGLLRMEEEGTVSVRVLVGANGRAKQIELISSPHTGFWTATKRHALRKWRFQPATKDGKAYESWITLKVRFEIHS